MPPMGAAKNRWEGNATFCSRGPSQFVERTLGVPDFSWQREGAGVFSLRETEREVVHRYVINPPRHHADGTTLEDWKRSERPCNRAPAVTAFGSPGSAAEDGPMERRRTPVRGAHNENPPRGAKEPHPLRFRHGRDSRATNAQSRGCRAAHQRLWATG